MSNSFKISYLWIYKNFFRSPFLNPLVRILPRPPHWNSLLKPPETNAGKIATQEGWRCWEETRRNFQDQDQQREWGFQKGRRKWWRQKWLWRQKQREERLREFPKSIRSLNYLFYSNIAFKIAYSVCF